MTEQDRDVALVSAMAAGDAGEALESFYRRYAGVVFAMLLKVLRTRAEAEELLQEVFVELWRRSPSYDPSRGSVKTWVSRLARSRAIDALRARRRRTPESSVPAEEAALAAPILLQPDRAASDLRTRRAVRRAVGSLPPTQRETLLLCYWEGLSQSEVAEKMGVPLGTVKSRIAGAMRRLRGALEAEAPAAAPGPKDPRRRVA